MWAGIGEEIGDDDLGRIGNRQRRLHEEVILAFDRFGRECVYAAAREQRHEHREHETSSHRKTLRPQAKSARRCYHFAAKGWRTASPFPGELLDDVVVESHEAV